MELEFQIDRSSLLPLYAQLAEALKNAILSGELAFGEKLPSETELMVKYQLSRMTVRSAISLLCQDQYVEKIQGKGSFVRYCPLSQQGSIDVLLDVSDTYFSANYISSICKVLTEHQYRFVIHDTQDSQTCISGILSGILSNGSSGVILQPSHGREPIVPELLEQFAQLDAKKIPYLMLDRAYKEVPGMRVVFDDEGGGAAAAEHLLVLGHRRVAMVCCSDYIENELRRNGFNRKLQEKGLPPVKEIEVSPQLQDALCNAVQCESITAFFCFSDSVALKVLQMLQAADIRVPQDVSVVGYDDTVRSRFRPSALQMACIPSRQRPCRSI